MAEHIYGKKQYAHLVIKTGNENSRPDLPLITYAWQKGEKGKDDYQVLCDIEASSLRDEVKQDIVKFIQQQNISLTKNVAEKLNIIPDIDGQYPDYVIQQKQDCADYCFENEKYCVVKKNNIDRVHSSRYGGKLNIIKSFDITGLDEVVLDLIRDNIRTKYVVYPEVARDLGCQFTSGSLVKRCGYIGCLGAILPKMVAKNLHTTGKYYSNQNS